jgi:hypothetical protein
MVRRYLQPAVGHRAAHVPAVYQTPGRAAPLKERKAARTGRPIEDPVFAPEQDALRWSRFKDTAPQQMFAIVFDKLTTTENFWQQCRSLTILRDRGLLLNGPGFSQSARPPHP